MKRVLIAILLTLVLISIAWVVIAPRLSLPDDTLSMSKSKSIYFSLHKISTHYRIGRPDCIELPLSLQVLFEELKDEPLEQQLTDSVVEYYGEDHSSGVIIRTELIGSEEEFYYLELLTSGDIRKRPGSQTGPED